MVFEQGIQQSRVEKAIVQRYPVDGSGKLTKITVTIEGDIGEVIATLRGLAGRASSWESAMVEAEITETGSTLPRALDPVQSAEVLFGHPGQPQEPAWTASYVHTFWRNLSDTARQAMIRVSRSPNHTQKRAQLMHTLQLSQRELSGSLSSQGHSLNRLKRRRGDVNLPRPLTYDKNSDAYILDSHFADALVEIGYS